MKQDETEIYRNLPTYFKIYSFFLVKNEGFRKTVFYLIFAIVSFVKNQNSNRKLQENNLLALVRLCYMSFFHSFNH